MSRQRSSGLEVLAFYLRPDVQTVFEEFDGELGKLYGKVVGAESILGRDTKRMTQERTKGASEKLLSSCQITFAHRP